VPKHYVVMMYEGSGGKASRSLNLVTRWGWVWNFIGTMASSGM